MTRKRQHRGGMDEGLKPTKADNVREARRESGGRGECANANESEKRGERASARGCKGATVRMEGEGMGGEPPPLPPRRPPRGGPLTQRASTKASSNSLIGAEVFNDSGRGVWGRGEVVAIIPAGVSPYYFCKRNGLRQLFRKDTCSLYCPRFIVQGDDGKLHAPERVLWQMK